MPLVLPERMRGQRLVAVDGEGAVFQLGNDGSRFPNEHPQRSEGQGDRCGCIGRRSKGDGQLC